MADALIPVFLGKARIFDIDYLSTALSRDFLAGLVVEATLNEQSIVKSLKELACLACGTEGATRQAVLIRYWSLMLDLFKTLDAFVQGKPQFISLDVCESFLSLVDIHTAAFAFVSSLQGPLTYQVNSAIDFVCKEFPLSDFIIYIGVFCISHRPYISSKWRLWDAPVEHLKALCSYRDSISMNEILRANMSLCEFAIEFEDTPKELLRIVIFDTLHRTLYKHIPANPNLKKTVRLNLEKFHRLFSLKQIENLKNYCDQSPEIPSSPPVTHIKSKAERYGTTGSSVNLLPAYQLIERRESSDTEILKLKSGRRVGDLENALKVLARGLNFDEASSRNNFTELMQQLRDASLLPQDAIDEFKSQWYPLESTPTQGGRTPPRKVPPPSRQQTEPKSAPPTMDQDDPWANVVQEKQEKNQGREESKQPRSAPLRNRGKKDRPNRPKDERRRQSQYEDPIDLHKEIDGIIENRGCTEEDQSKVSELTARFTGLLKSLPRKVAFLSIGSASLGLWIKSTPFDGVLVFDDASWLQEIIDSLIDTLNASTFASNITRFTKPIGQIVQYTDKFLNLTMSVSFNSRVQVHHKKLLSKYVELDTRFTSLVLVVKIWAQARGMLNAEYYSGYEWTLLVLNFCQTRSPPVLPSLQTIQHRAQIECGVDVWYDTAFNKDSLNNTELPDLVLEFFRWYGIEVKDKGDAVVANSRVGTLEAKTSEQNAVIAIVDPFYTTALGTSIVLGSRQAVTLQSALGKAYKHLEAGKSLLDLL